MVCLFCLCGLSVLLLYLIYLMYLAYLDQIGLRNLKKHVQENNKQLQKLVGISQKSMLYGLKKGARGGHLSHLGLPLHASCISRPSGTSFLRVLGPSWDTLLEAFWAFTSVVGLPRRQIGPVLGVLLLKCFSEWFLMSFWVGLGCQKH